MSCELGEGPIYERDLHRLRFFDINKGKLHILDLNKGPESIETHHCGTIRFVTFAVLNRSVKDLHN